MPRPSRLAVVLMLWICAASLAADDPAVGTWEYREPTTGHVLAMTLNADGTGTMDGEAIRWKLSGNTLSITESGDTTNYTVRIDGTTLNASGGDLDAPISFTRKGVAAQKKGLGAKLDEMARSPEGAAAAAPATDPLVGVWTDGQGQIEFRADGNCLYLGVTMTYTAADGKLTLKGPAATVQFAYRVDGDKLITTIEGESQTLTRVKPGDRLAAAPAGAGADAQAAGIAGVYVSQEASVDPNIVMTHTQYLILYPDGSVGWAKAEGGATRTAVSECIERFSSFRTNPQIKGQTYGTWQSDGRNVVIQWNIWDNLRCNGSIDASGALQLEKMGVLQEGATLEFKKQ